MSDRTPAERRVDDLARELDRLRLAAYPTREQRARMTEIANRKLPAAWRAVYAVRDRER